MDVIIYDILLDTQYAGCRRQIELKKGEANSKIFRIELCKGTEPIEIAPKEAMAIIRGCKEDGTVIVNPAKITNESKIEYEVGSQDTAAVGTTWYEVQVVAKDGESYKILYSAQFKAVVKDTLVEDGKITSSDEFGLLVDTITENKEWKENKDKELASWMEEREKEIDTKEKEHETKITENEKAHVELIYDNTLVFKETKIFTKAEDTTPEILDFNSEYIEKDCDAIEVINNDNSRVKIKIDDYNTIKTIGPGQTVRVVLGDIEKYKINATNLFPGQESIDITKVTLKKYILVNKIGSFFSNYAENELVQNDLFVERLAKNTASYLPSFMASYCASDPMFMSSMTEALPKDDGFMSKVGKRIESFIDQTLPKNDEFMTGVGKRIGSFWDGNCASQTAYALASNTASYLPSFMASYCASDPMFMSSITEALPSDSTFINSVGRKMAKADSFCNELASSPPFGSAVLKNALVSLELSKYVPRTTTICGIPLTSHISPSAIARNVAPILPSTGTFVSDIAKKLPSDTTFISNMGSKMASVLPSTGTFVSDTGLALASNTTFIRSMANVLPSYISSTLPSYIASGIASDSSFLKSVADSSGFGTELATNTFLQSGLIGNDTFMCDVADKAVNNMSSGTLNTLASVLPSNTMFMDNVAKIASNSTFISTVTTDPLFMRGVANNFPSHMTSVTRSYLASYIEEPLATNVSFMAKVGSNNTFINTLLAATSFINGVAEKMPSRLGFFGVYQTITTPNESGKEYFKFEDYSIKGKYSINSDRNKINIPRKLLSIKVRGNFSGAQSCKNCKICGEVIDENNQIVFSNFEIFRVKAGSDADGLVTGTQPFNAEYILNADLDDSSLGNKTLYIRFYVKYDTMASFYTISSWGDCSVTITEI
uniref:BppU domain protein n=1 Tax=Myoviridae sp. ct8iP21 TaxID=2825041 RepID=A0A8S5V4E0_9CAUD|nr:MAG TPA: BppU domain protein [Myoviridae sp. ct8iP21]